MRSLKVPAQITIQLKAKALQKKTSAPYFSAAVKSSVCEKEERQWGGDTQVERKDFSVTKGKHKRKENKRRKQELVYIGQRQKKNRFHLNCTNMS